MTLYTLSIRRPVLAIVMSITIVLFGLLGFSFLGVREFPSLDPPVITVSTSYRGASAEVIESQVTEPIEAAVNGVDGIRTLTSASRDGRSTVQAEFDLGIDLERAANDVRDHVSRAMYSLPPDVDPPIVSKADADARPIAGISVRSDRRSLLELSRLAQEAFVERLQTIPNVASVDIWGEKTYAMRLWIDPAKLAAYRLSPIDVRDAVVRENVELPSGRIEGEDVELPVRTMSRLNTPEDFNNLILKSEADRIVRFRDVGAAELGPLNERTVLKRDGIPMVLVVVRPQPGANYVTIADEFRRRVEMIERTLPDDVEVAWAFDASRYIRESVAEVQQTIVVAFVLVMLVIFAFLRDWRTTIIPVLVIPVALIGSGFVMYLAGFTINVLTLLALVLAIGLVVDDAIVVVEVIYAKIEAGHEPKSAGVEGTREIFFAVIATTVALVAVFMPILFLGGLVGRLFREFGITLAGAVVISSFVALTLTPMLATRLLKKRTRQPRLYTATEPFFRALAASYRQNLAAFLNRRWLAIPMVVVCFGVVALFFATLPRELAPLEDRSSISLSVRGPEGATFEYMDRFMDRLNVLIADQVPEADATVTVTAPGFGAASSVNSGFGRITLVDPELRDRSQGEIADALAVEVQRLTEAQTYITQSPTIAVGRRRGLPVQFVIQAANMEGLQNVLPSFLAAAESDPTFTYVDVNLKFDKPELEVTIDRERAQDLGISVLRIAQTLQLALSEQRLGYFIMDGKQYEVIGQVMRGARDETIDLRNLFVTSGGRPPVLLDKLVHVTETSSPPQIFRFDRYESATVSAALAPGKTIGDGIEAMQRIADRELDETFATTLAGESRDFAESATSLVFVFVLALLLVYLALAAQFESFRDPLIIMFTVPLALAGALFALWYFSQTLNIFSQIGMIMLIGLVTKNGILIVEFANQRKAAGLPLLDAIVEGATARLRPVLMTTLSTVLGILPIALGIGAGAESRIPMGVAVIGGLLLGTLLTLFVVPAMMSFLTSTAAREQRLV
jgi:multidrug efflux pump